MSKITCNTIKDILPLYVDEVVSDDTTIIVSEHLENCVECRKKYESMKKEITIPIENHTELKTFKKKWHRRTLFKSVVIAVLLVVILISGYYAYHWAKSANENNLNALAEQAENYLGKDELYIEEITKKGNYLAALCTDNKGAWYMCVYERDNLFENRWYASGSLNGLNQGKMSSWNYGSPQEEVVLIFCGISISDDVNWYTFQNDKITYTCPVENNTVLDIFIISDSSNINGTPTMLDAEKQPLN